MTRLPRVHTTRPSAIVPGDVLTGAAVTPDADGDSEMHGVTGACRFFIAAESPIVTRPGPLTYYAELFRHPLLRLTISYARTDALPALIGEVDWRIVRDVALEYIQGRLTSVIFWRHAHAVDVLTLATDEASCGRAVRAGLELLRRHTDHCYIGRVTWRADIEAADVVDLCESILAPVLFSWTGFTVTKPKRLDVCRGPDLPASNHLRTLWATDENELTFMTTRALYANVSSVRAGLHEMLGPVWFDDLTPMRVTRERSPRWNQLFEWRHPFPQSSWRMIHDEVFNYAVCLVRLLPAYVILWILQQMRRISWQREHRVIALIQNVLASVRKVK